MARQFTPQIPADVPANARQEYLQNLAMITKNSGRLMLFACDQKIEHLNHDFVGAGIAADAAHPEHLFAIASQGTIGALAAHYGLIARYGAQYPTIPYIVKLNGKTDLVSKEVSDPYSQQLWDVTDAVALKHNSGLSICGVGYTIYLGSEYESTMLGQAAQIIRQAHEYGLVAVVWIYPRGKSIKNDQDPALLAGAAGLANALGADFVKIKPTKNTADLLAATAAAGNTGVICSGGESIAPQQFLTELHAQLHEGKASGCATGRNIFQKSLPEALAFTHAIAAIVYEHASPQEALRIYTEKLS